MRGLLCRSEPLPRSQSRGSSCGGGWPAVRLVLVATPCLARADVRAAFICLRQRQFRWPTLYIIAFVRRFVGGHRRARVIPLQLNAPNLGEWPQAATIRGDRGQQDRNSRKFFDCVPGAPRSSHANAIACADPTQRSHQRIALLCGGGKVSQDVCTRSVQYLGKGSSYESRLSAGSFARWVRESLRNNKFVAVSKCSGSSDRPSLQMRAADNAPERLQSRQNLRGHESRLSTWGESCTQGLRLERLFVCCSGALVTSGSARRRANRSTTRRSRNEAVGRAEHRRSVEGAHRPLPRDGKRRPALLYCRGTLLSRRGPWPRVPTPHLRTRLRARAAHRTGSRTIAQHASGCMIHDSCILGRTTADGPCSQRHPRRLQQSSPLVAARVGRARAAGALPLESA
eukprot:scaffold4931_cov392-Prasinococcus_capsulatus_cf.AAC.2